MGMNIPEELGSPIRIDESIYDDKLNQPYDHGSG